jgi:proteasome accessory factor A
MSASDCIPKLTGADIELGNFIEGTDDPAHSARDASRLLLAEIRAANGAASELDETDETDRRQPDPQDHDRTFLAGNGGCAYIDLDHLELCIPEVLSAWDHVAWWHAMLRLAGAAQHAINARDSARKVRVLANNADGMVSYGAHLNVMVSRQAWENVALRKPHYTAWLAAFQASSLPITGQGCVGSANGAPPVSYQLSQRADWFETVTGIQTTYLRPLVNTRDEPLCGRWWERRQPSARLHSIFFDTTLCEVATLLRVGMMQIALAMVEAGEVDLTLALEDPLRAVRRWSHDPLMQVAEDLVAGGRVTVLELQRRFLEQAARFVASGATDGLVERAGEIVALWDDTLTRLERGDWTALARRLDWVLKLSCLERAFAMSPQLHWGSPEARYIDQLYASVDHEDGLYWNFADRGLVERVVSDDAIRHATSQPPGNTRAWGRVALQRLAGPALAAVDWDFVRVRLSDPVLPVAGSWRVDLANPLDFTRATHGDLLATDDIDQVLYALGAEREAQPAHPRSTTTSWHGGLYGRA